MPKDDSVIQLVSSRLVVNPKDRTDFQKAGVQQS